MTANAFWTVSDHAQFVVGRQPEVISADVCYFRIARDSLSRLLDRGKKEQLVPFFSAT